MRYFQTRAAGQRGAPGSLRPERTASAPAALSPLPEIRWGVRRAWSRADGHSSPEIFTAIASFERLTWWATAVLEA